MFQPPGTRARPPTAAPPPHPLGRAPQAHLPDRRPHLPALREHSTRRRRRPSLHNRPGHPRAPAPSLQASSPRPGHPPAPARLLLSAVRRGLTTAPGLLYPPTGHHLRQALPPASSCPLRPGDSDPLPGPPPRKPGLFFLGPLPGATLLPVRAGVYRPALRMKSSRSSTRSWMAFDTRTCRSSPRSHSA